MKVLLIGAGGREHALAQALNEDDQLKELHVAPGNPGIADIAQCHPVGIDDHQGILALAHALQIDLVVIGPEKPLVTGLADILRAEGFAVFGPSAAAAQLEGSKDFAKQVMHEANVPTARSFTCVNETEVESALDAFGAPYVVKHDGLAAGKGVVVTNDRSVALEHASFDHLSEASQRVVIEEYLAGPEISLFGICDGTTVRAMEPAQDFKRAFDGDQGPNTGGMGAYSPLPWAPKNIVEETLAKVLQPTVDQMIRRGTPFVGLLYAGLALTDQGIKVIEFNARFGDPETQVLLPRLKTPLAQLLYQAATGTLHEAPALEWSEDSAVTVVLASEGYPATPIVGRPITGLPDGTGGYADTRIFHAGTAITKGSLVSAGGRVLAVTGVGASLAVARTDAYHVISQIDVPGGFYRTDIALTASNSIGQVQE